ncbi:hypothetical protein QYM36_007070, partial [Artemia franciscana]
CAHTIRLFQNENAAKLAIVKMTLKRKFVICSAQAAQETSQWNHIEDLDSFFTRVYNYHRRHGFLCILSKELLDLVQFAFVVFFSVYLCQCVDYPILFRENLANDTNPGGKIRLGDALTPLSECSRRLPPVLIGCIVVSSMFWVFRTVRFVYHIVYYWEIRSFYLSVLKIKESELDNFTWTEVQSRLRQAQKDHLMCIHKAELSDLDIHHRILRFTNYFVAMVNKHVLPITFQVPIFGEMVFLTKGLKYNLELILFWGSGAPFDSSWHLKEEYKRASKRQELADRLSKRMRTVGFVNLVLSPLVVIWQLLHSVFRYAEELKRDPSLLGVRKWSMYGRFYVRHFNELDHELDARLSRAYNHASRYTRAFVSPFMAIVARHLQFICGSLLFVLICLTLWDEDVITVEHVITLMSGLGGIVAICSAFIPEENVVYFHDDLLANVLVHIHYLPGWWVEQAHTAKVRAGFAQLFQLKVAFLAEELLSPIITPFVLLYHFPKASLKVVDFLRNNTVDVVGVGDVCSFAQLDVRRHGDPLCQSITAKTATHVGQEKLEKVAKMTSEPVASPAEECKTELSLVHFALTNPEWKPPESSQTYLECLQQNMRVAPSELGQIVQSDDELPSLLATAQPAWGRSFLLSNTHNMSLANGNQSFMQSPFLHMGRLSYRTAPLSNMAPSRMGSIRGEPGLSTVDENIGVTTSQDRAENATSREIINLVDMARSAIFIHGSRQGQARREGFSIRASAEGECEDHEMSPLLRLVNST